MLLWSILVVFTGIYMTMLTSDTVINSYVILWKSFSIIVVAFGLAIFVGYMIGNRNPFNPLNITRLVPNTSVVITLSSANSFDSILSNAKLRKMPTMILFTAYGCEQCKKLEKNILSNEVIQAQLRCFFVVKADMSLSGSSAQDLAKKYQIAGTPEILFFDANGVLNNVRIIGADVTVESMDQTLEKIYGQVCDK
jgi:thiol:disulfide interchange protein DsbD